MENLHVGIHFNISLQKRKKQNIWFQKVQNYKGVNYAGETALRNVVTIPVLECILSELKFKYFVNHKSRKKITALIEAISRTNIKIVPILMKYDIFFIKWSL